MYLYLKDNIVERELAEILIENKINSEVKAKKEMEILIYVMRLTPLIQYIKLIIAQG